MSGQQARCLIYRHNIAEELHRCSLSAHNSVLNQSSVRRQRPGTGVAVARWRAAASTWVGTQQGGVQHMKRYFLRAAAAASLGALAAMTLAGTASAQKTIKCGILHWLAGTMAISETTLKDVMLMLIEEQNKKGGVLG